ncbi:MULTISPECIES: thioesterase II family protein [Staphylococcus]|uniref:thioesterase II family protein n=1 Tax=Staphylococcus TaxID=1279 RepID=UPI00076B3ED4|nr:MULTISPECIES: thioesterase domain-containing protein [Staphylococcus]AMG63686.1 thioesterase [Staphylococcus lugdunensis]MCH8647462.1 thioesterase domain-containing protein [Staphylococcus lugdunensis]MCI2815043.1 thioesterase domain-containing protein [Staphylococcus lugdunensis]MDU0967062.1 thioesterase domain-containing protein [Staphylococcus lugdunensis]MDU1964606.1 thioesterase domain-containing protein [Staphylococcus lugdunensis]
MTNIQVLAFPYACGSLDSYSKLCHIDGIDLIKYELPGRRSRISEKLDSLNSVMIEVCNVINFNSPYVIFGHSMGGYLANELCRFIEINKLHKPRKVIISGQCPVDNNNDSLEEYNELSLDNTKTYISLFNGTPKEIINNKELMEFYGEIFYQDMQFINQYKMNNSSKKVKSNVEVWYSDQDIHVKEENIMKWKDYAVNSCNFKKFKGDHFFINNIFQDPKLTFELLCC